MLICSICGAFNYFTIDDYVIHRDTFTIFEDTFLFPFLNVNITQNDVRYRRFFQAHYFDGVFTFVTVIPLICTLRNIGVRYS